MTGHTPEEWIAEPYNEDWEASHIVEDGKIIADVFGGPDGNSTAILMAAAPELKEALQWADDILSDLPDDNDDDLRTIRKNIRAALAKSEGRDV